MKNDPPARERSFMKVNSDAHMLPYGQQSAECRSGHVTSVPAEATHPVAAGAAEWESNFPSHSFSFPRATTGASTETLKFASGLIKTITTTNNDNNNNISLCVGLMKF